jgi:hypothetical protein
VVFAPGLGPEDVDTRARTHTLTQLDTPQPIELPCTSDQLVPEAATYTTHNKPKRRTPMPLAGSEPAIPAVKQQQTYALYRTATGIG